MRASNTRLSATVLFLAVALHGWEGALAVEPVKSEKIVRGGPLAGLPSAPGPHLEKLKALGDDSWLNLGAPAPDPQWGRALGRSWSPRMPFAPELRGAFITGEGNHGWVNPKTRRQMDDFWFYDANAHRWICVHPGTDADNTDAVLTVNKDGFSATKSGELIPVSLLGHAYECVTYDTDLKRFMCMNLCTLYGPASDWARKHGIRRDGSPWYFDTATGKWGRQLAKGPFPNNAHYTDMLVYVPSKRQTFFHAFGWGRNHSYFYDAEANLWREVKTNWTEGPKMNGPNGGDVVACYDSKRDRIYVGKGDKLFFFDVKALTWVDLQPKGELKGGLSTIGALLNYDAVNDRVVAVCLGLYKVFVYDPDTNTCVYTSGVVPKEMKQLNGFYDPALNVHFVHTAIDNREGVIWAYRYKQAPALPIVK